MHPKLIHSTGSEILAFGSHCSVNFRPILDCVLPKFNLKYDDVENIKTDRVNAVVFNLYQIKRLKFFFWDTRYIMDNSVKGGLTQFWELLTVIPCASKDFKR